MELLFLGRELRMTRSDDQKTGERQGVYRSLVISLFNENGTILTGAIASCAAVVMTATHIGSPVLWLIAFLTGAVGIARYCLGRAFNRIADPGSLSLSDIRKWDLRFSVGAIACTALLGAWCLFASLPGDPFPRFISVVVTFANIVGICTRSSALPRLVNLQLITMVGPMVAGLYITGDEYAVLGLLLIPFMFSLQRIAAAQRKILLDTIAQRQKAERLATQMHTALENVPQGVVMFDANGELEVSNGHIQSHTHRSALSLRGASADRMLTVLEKAGGADGADVLAIREWIHNSRERSIMHTMSIGHDERRVVRFRASRMVNGGFIATFEDVTREVVAENRIQHMTRFDRLTGLVNRSHLLFLLKEQMDQRRDDEAVVAMIINVRKFKKINDMMGYQVADLLLCEVAQRIEKVAGPDAICARFSSDEFMIVMRATGCEDLAVHTADLLEDAVNDTIMLHGRSVALSAKIGVSIARKQTTADELIKEAGLALAFAQNSDRHTWQMFDDAIGEQLEVKRQLEDSLRQAVEQGSFELNYQPIVDLKGKRVAVCEALIRWNHPTLGMVPPPTFLPVVEELNLMDELGAWVIRTACETCAGWSGNVGVAVNLSAAQFRNQGLISVVKSALADAKLDPERLELEVTETLMLHDVEEAIRQLNALKKLGVRISLDDFGTGYSSLSYMNQLPLDKVKIDRSFVTGLMSDTKSQTLITGISALGRGLDLTVVVEGVETLLELHRLMKHTQVDQVQGYLFSKPLDADTVGGLLKPKSSALREMLERIPDARKQAA